MGLLQPHRRHLVAGAVAALGLTCSESTEPVSVASVEMTSALGAIQRMLNL